MWGPARTVAMFAIVVCPLAIGCSETDTPAAPDETISAPARPSGPRVTETWEAESYSTSGSSSNLGHAVEYQFDWGDGKLSVWGAPAREQTWNNAGIFRARARARCVQHPVSRSPWSAGELAVSVKLPPESISPPQQPQGLDHLQSGVFAVYTTSGAISNLGHGLEYRFDWGNGTTSPWRSTPAAVNAWAR